MNIPANLKYSNDHEWVRVEGNEAFIGITDFAQGQLGDIVFVDVTSVGGTKYSARSRPLRPYPTLSCPWAAKYLSSTKRWRATRPS